VVVQSESAVESLPSTRLPAAHAVAVTGRDGPGGGVAVRDAAVRRIAAQVSGQPDLGRVFDDVLHHAMELFEIEGAGLWTLEEGERPFRLAAEHGLAPALIEAISGPTPTPRSPRRQAAAAARRAVASTRPQVIRTSSARTREDPARVQGGGARTRQDGAGTDCCVPVIVLDEPVGLLVLSRAASGAWSAEDLDLAAAFAVQMGVTIQNARLYSRVQSFAARLEAIKDLAGNLNRIHEVAAIGQAIVAEIRRLFDSDTARVYAVDHATGMCEPIAFGGVFLGTAEPSREVLQVEIGRGLTGWVAANNAPIRVADARTDPRRLTVGSDEEPESMLFAPMTYEEVVRGVIVVSKKGFDRYAADDLTTLSIFAGFAAQSLVNAENIERLSRQQVELEHRRSGQRALLEVNETLLGSGDPREVLELIADGLKAVVRYDNLTIYRLDRVQEVRVAVLARDRFADIILAEKIEIGSGLTGWAVERGEAVLANDAQLDPRAMNIPGTPSEAESLIVVPLRVGGEVIGTLNVGRMGEAKAHFTPDEFELVKLFAGQASIALQTAEAIQAAELRADRDALTGLRNHGVFQAAVDDLLERGRLGSGTFALLMLDLDGFKAFNDTRGHPAGDRLLRAVANALQAAVREDDRVYRYGGDEFAILLPGVGREEAEAVADRLASGVVALEGPDDGPGVTISIGIAMYPADGRIKNDLVMLADAELYLAKGLRRHEGPAVRGARAGRGATSRPLAATDPEPGADPRLEVEVHANGDGLRRLADASFEALVIHRDGYVLEVNAAFADLFGPATDQVAGTPVLDLFPAAARSAIRVQLTGDREAPFETVALLADGTEGPVELVGRTIQYLDEAPARATAVRDIRERRAIQERLAHQSSHDALTSLPNRSLFLDRVARALTSARQRGAAPAAVLLLDLDRFKVVNESLGHAVGDQILAAVGWRLGAAVRPGDTLARLGGDEFALLLDGIADEAGARVIAERLIDTLAEPFPADDRDINIGASVGVAVATSGGVGAADLLRDAEIALYRAKSSSLSRVAVFEPSMGGATMAWLELDTDLHRAVERGELQLYYQPLIDLRTGVIVGHEALVRWEHPTRGLLGPDDFIPLAEETGLILGIGQWVLSEACQQTRAWQLAMPTEPPLSVSVNLSGRQFTQPDLAATVAGVLAASGLPASSLELEITETVAMSNAAATGVTLRTLRELGVRLALDDFGTGYSSLAYLSEMALDSIKVDRAFVAGLAVPGTNHSIIAAVSALARGLGLQVTAEGIEEPEQLAAVIDLGCDRGQGFFLAIPLPAPAALASLIAEPVRDLRILMQASAA